MLQNFITDDDLKSYYPQLSKYLWKDSTDYMTQIREAFDLDLDDLRSRKIDVRKLHLPLDLNRPEGTTTNQDALASFTKTATFTSDYIVGLQGFRRFVFDCSVISNTATYKVTLQGSNDIDSPPVTWTEMGSVEPDLVGILTVLAQEEYKYYRYVLTVTGTGSISYRVSLYETYPDRWIVWKSFEIIFRDFIRERGDVWDMRMVSARENYLTAMEASKYIYDKADDNLPAAEEEQSNEIRLVR